MRIAALDFETANHIQGSICSVGIAIYDNDIEQESFTSLVRPHTTVLARGWTFQHIHGISQADATRSPELPELLPDMAALLSSADITVCHNAPFDIKQLEHALNLYQARFIPFPYLCTLKLARRFYPNEENHRLNTMAQKFGFSFNHHDALDDARAAAFLMTRLTQDMSLDEWSKKYNITPNTFSR